MNLEPVIVRIEGDASGLSRMVQVAQNMLRGFNNQVIQQSGLVGRSVADSINASSNQAARSANAAQAAWTTTMSRVQTHNRAMMEGMSVVQSRVTREAMKAFRELDEKAKAAKGVFYSGLVPVAHVREAVGARMGGQKPSTRAFDEEVMALARIKAIRLVELSDASKATAAERAGSLRSFAYGQHEIKNEGIFHFMEAIDRIDKQNAAQDLALFGLPKVSGTGLRGGAAAESANQIRAQSNRISRELASAERKAPQVFGGTQFAQPSPHMAEAVRVAALFRQAGIKDLPQFEFPKGGAGMTPRMSAEYTDKGKVLINPTMPVRTSVGGRKANPGIVGQDLGDHISHEIGHHLHRKITGDAAFWTDRALTAAEKIVAGKVSKYAKVNMHEFVAETFTGMTKGVQYPPDVMEMYKRFQGPESPGPILAARQPTPTVFGDVTARGLSLQQPGPSPAKMAEGEVFLTKMKVASEEIRAVTTMTKQIREASAKLQRGMLAESVGAPTVSRGRIPLNVLREPISLGPVRTIAAQAAKQVEDSVKVLPATTTALSKSAETLNRMFGREAIEQKRQGETLSRMFGSGTPPPRRPRPTGFASDDDAEQRRIRATQQQVAALRRLQGVSLGGFETQADFAKGRHTARVNDIMKAYWDATVVPAISGMAKADADKTSRVKKQMEAAWSAIFEPALATHAKAPQDAIKRGRMATEAMWESVWVPAIQKQATEQHKRFTGPERFATGKEEAAILKQALATAERRKQQEREILELIRAQNRARQQARVGLGRLAVRGVAGTARAAAVRAREFAARQARIMSVRVRRVAGPRVRKAVRTRINTGVRRLESGSAYFRARLAQIRNYSTEKARLLRQTLLRQPRDSFFGRIGRSWRARRMGFRGRPPQPPAVGGAGAAGGGFSGRVGGVFGSVLGPAGSVIGMIGGMALRFTGLVAVITGASAALFALRRGFDMIGDAISGAIKWTVQLGVELEKTEVAFRVMTGSATKGAELLKGIQDLAIISPFTIRQLNQAGQMLLGFGVPVNAILPILSRLGDIAAGDSQKLMRLTLAFSQVVSAGRLMGTEMRQFAEAGVGTEDFAKTIGKTQEQFRELVRQGRIGPDVMIQTVNRLTSATGRFFGLNQQQLKTVGGAWNSFVERLQVIGGRLGKQLFADFDVVQVINRMAFAVESNLRTIFDNVRNVFRHIKVVMEELAKFGVAAWQTIAGQVGNSGTGLENTRQITQSLVGIFIDLGDVGLKTMALITEGVLTVIQLLSHMTKVTLGAMDTMSEWSEIAYSYAEEYYHRPFGLLLGRDDEQHQKFVKEREAIRENRSGEPSTVEELAEQTVKLVEDLKRLAGLDEGAGVPGGLAGQAGGVMADLKRRWLAGRGKSLVRPAGFLDASVDFWTEEREVFARKTVGELGRNILTNLMPEGPGGLIARGTGFGLGVGSQISKARRLGGDMAFNIPKGGPEQLQWARAVIAANRGLGTEAVGGMIGATPVVVKAIHDGFKAVFDSKLIPNFFKGFIDPDVKNLARTVRDDFKKGVTPLDQFERQRSLLDRGLELGELTKKEHEFAMAKAVQTLAGEVSQWQEVTPPQALFYGTQEAMDALAKAEEQSKSMESEMVDLMRQAQAQRQQQMADQKRTADAVEIIARKKEIPDDMLAF